MDVTAGLRPEIDYPILDPKLDVSAGENHAFWFFDDKARCALLNCHIQGGGTVGAGKVVHKKGEEKGIYEAFPDWRRRRVMFPIALDDDLMVDFDIADSALRDGYGGLGGWTFKCVEPFRRWIGTFRGTPRLTSRAETMASPIDLQSGRVPVEVDVEFVSALPPIFRGGEYMEDLPGKEIGLAGKGIPAYEQLSRVTGAIRIQGRDEYKFTGTGLRTHRYGRRTVASNFSTSWVSALFPSGRAFLAVQYMDKDDKPFYSEGWAREPNGIPAAARVGTIPMLDYLDCVGRKCELVLDGPKGAEHIEIEILSAAYNYGIGIDHTPGTYGVCHTMSRFRWNGEETTGLMELGTFVDRLKT